MRGKINRKCPSLKWKCSLIPNNIVLYLEPTRWRKDKGLQMRKTRNEMNKRKTNYITKRKLWICEKDLLTWSSLNSKRLLFGQPFWAQCIYGIQQQNNNEKVHIFLLSLYILPIVLQSSIEILYYAIMFPGSLLKRSMPNVGDKIPLSLYWQVYGCTV